MSTPSLVMIIILLVAILIALYFFQMRNKSIDKLKQLEAKKQKLEERNVSDHLRKVKELNLVGETESLFEKWRKNWDEIVERSIPGIVEGLRLSEIYINKYSFSKFKDQIHFVENMIDTVDGEIDAILLEVDALIKNTQESVDLMAEVSLQHRNLRKNLLAHRHSYSLCEEKLEERLDAIKDQIVSFEEQAAHGNYLSAKGICEDVKVKVANLQKIMDYIPTLQTECKTYIPTQIDDVAEGCKQMEKDGFVLHHLQWKEELADLSQHLEKSVAQLKELQIDEVKETTVFIHGRLDEICENLEEEVKAKQSFEKETEVVKQDIVAFEEKIVTVKEETKLAKQSYELSDKDIEVQKNMETQIGVLGNKYENLHTQVEQQDVAYSVLQKELQNIRQQLADMDVAYGEYVEKIHALRKDELTVYETLQKAKQDLLDVSRQLKNANLPRVPHSYYELLTKVKTSMDMTYKELEKRPLDMQIVTKLLQQTTQSLEKVMTDVEKLIYDAHFSEKLIQYGNRLRSRSSKNAQILQKAEKDFREAQYSTVIEEVTVFIETFEPGAVDRLKTMISK